jgi:hypothetical protein
MRTSLVLLARKINYAVNDPSRTISFIDQAPS